MRYTVSAFFAALTVHAAFGLARSLRTDPVEYPLSAEPVDFAAPPARNSHELAERIAAQHLFGTVTASTPSPPPEPAERTGGPATLVGVIFGGEEKASRAILELDGVQQSYRPGDKLPTGEMLTDVHANKVILKGAQGLYTLVLRHEGHLRLSEPRHFVATTENDITVIDLNGPAPSPTLRTGPAAVSTEPTLQRLKSLRMRLLGGG
ncbi:MAG TPA: type II secretion system protein N [Gammaproteobacteria bacterium]|nr:type II secretion system protein N [Gammaproteobacteria bacterium]